MQPGLSSPTALTPVLEPLNPHNITLNPKPPKPLNRLNRLNP